MTVLMFLLAIAAILGLVIAVDGGEDGRLRRPPSGLLAWLVTGNWPAKIGAALIVVGTGALLRYAAINIDLPPALKLSFGIAMAGVLGFASMMTAPARRTVSLMLGGAAAGVSYLTAYTAFVLYGYLDNVMGLGLLVLTAIVTGMFAVRRAALSLALLAMVGAYLAPAFAIGDPGPQLVYGYYVAASTLTLVMVAMRGWRPLIHLSFAFTLVGGVFFAWSAHYYTPAHFDVMAPMLLILAALHVAMPLVERGDNAGGWLERLDLIYLLLLPLAVTLLAVAISPSRASLSLVLIGLGIIWGAAAVYLRSAGRQGSAAHALIGGLLICFGTAARFRGLPWDVIALAGSVVALAISVRSSQSQRLHSVVAGVALLLGSVHAVTALGDYGTTPFFNSQFIERMIAAGLLLYAGVLARRVKQTLDSVLMYLGSGWAILTIGGEIIRWNLVSLALALHWTLILTALAAFFLGSRMKTLASWALVIPIAIATTVPAAAIAASFTASIVTMIIGAAALVAFALRPDDDESSGIDRGAAILLVPIAGVLWAQRVAELADIHSTYFPLAVAAGSAVLALFALGSLSGRGGGWRPSTASIFGAAATILLAYATLVDIERSGWAVGTELICLAGLALLVLNARLHSRALAWLRPAAICGFALFLQAMLLRWLGPDGNLSAASIAQMDWPALTSLLWAGTGAALTVSSRKRASRSLWVAGATLLVITAVKLMLIDFGSLGELANILAVIAAGGVFLLVGWLAPMPPAAQPSASEEEETYTPGIGWMIAAIAIGALLVSRYSVNVIELLAWANKEDGRSVAHEALPRATTQPPFLSPPAAVPESTYEAAEETVVPSSDVGENRTHESPPPEIAAEAATLNPPPVIESACARFAAQLPSEYEIYVAGGREGRRLDVPAGRSRDLTAMFEVDVNVPGRNVLLVLGAPTSALWAVRSGSDANIVGIWLTGRGKHEVIGVSPRIPVLESDDFDTACRHFHVSGDNQSEVKATVAAVFRREPQAQIVARDGEIVIGERAASVSSGAEEPSDSVSASSKVHDGFVPAAREEGIQQLISRGTLRRATLADYNRWVRETPDSSHTAPGTYLFRTYLITGPMTFPSGLHGAHRATFILLPGVPHPNGDPGHSDVIQAK